MTSCVASAGRVSDRNKPANLVLLGEKLQIFNFVSSYLLNS